MEQLKQAIVALEIDAQEKPSVPWEEAAVIKELAKVFGKKYIKEIKETLDLEDEPYKSFGECGKFEADGIEYTLFPSDDEAESIATKVVSDDLESEPEIFNQDFLQQHISISDTDRGMIASDLTDSYVDDIEDDRVVEEAGMTDEYEAAEDDAKEAIVESARAELRRSMYEDAYEALADPIQYFVHDQGLYSQEELMKQSFISIDTEEAAEEAIRIDGWQHFLSRYDGNSEETPNGLVYIRES